MEDLKSILANYHPKKNQPSSIRDGEPKPGLIPTVSEIPDILFDQVMTNFRLSRQDILLLMYLYRSVWTKPNLYKAYGIGPMISYSETAKQLNLTIDEFHQSIRHLESYGLIETIRAGQFFVRKYFTEQFDQTYGQTYDDF